MISEYFHCKITAFVVSFVQPAYVYFLNLFSVEWWRHSDLEPCGNRKLSFIFHLFRIRDVVVQKFRLKFLKCFPFKVPMKWKIEVLKNRRTWKAVKSEEEWCFPFCHISSRSRDIQDFCIMQIRYIRCVNMAVKTQNREYLCK